MVHHVPVADGVQLVVDLRDGPGSPVLLVHGLASNRRLWDGVVEGLVAAGHAVASVDLRGHGESDRPDAGYGVEEVAGDLARVVRHLGWDRPLVAGQSWGGNLVLQLAAASPELVGAVACIDGGWIDLGARFPDWESCRRALSPPTTAGLPVDALEQRLRAVHPDWPETGIDGVLACWEIRSDGTVAPRFTLERHLLALRGLWEDRPAARYPLIGVPVLLVPAGPGTDASRAEVRAAEAGLAEVTTTWLDGDHDLHAQQPGAVAALLHRAAS